MVARTLLALMLVTGGLAMMMVPTASAQDAQPVTVDLNCPDNPGEIRPLGPPGQWSCTAEVQFQGGGFSDPARPVSLQIDTSGEASWMNVIISPNAFTITPPNSPDGEGIVEKEFKVSVSLTQNAPAFVATQLTLDPTLQGQEIHNPQANPTQLAVTPGYFNLYNVRMDQKIAEGGPDTRVDFPITIDNFSNGDTRFEFTMVQEEAPAGHEFTLPSPLILRSEATGGDVTQDTALFQVFTPFKNGYVNRIASMQLQIDSFYAVDTTVEGASSQVSTLTKTKGFYVPGPGAALSAMAMLGVALALTKSRGRIE